MYVGVDFMVGQTLTDESRKMETREQKITRTWWRGPVIPATQEVEEGGSQVQGQPGRL